MGKNIFVISLSILIVFFTMSFVGCNNQNSTKEQYQLQEKCKKSSQDFFQNKYGNGTVSNENGNSHSIYQCHYNKKLNKCFILIITEGNVNNDNNKSYYEKSLFDVNENQEIGIYYMTKTSTVCSFNSGKMCENSSEWDELIKPYMEE